MTASTVTIKLKGHVKLVARDRQGNKKVLFDNHNLIVNGGLDSVVNLLAFASSEHKITKLGFGSGSTAPSAGQTNLDSPIAIKDIIDPDGITVKPGGAVGTVVFQVTLNFGEGNGSTVREIGLLRSDDTLFARQTVGSIEKTASMALDAFWVISCANED